MRTAPERSWRARGAALCGLLTLGILLVLPVPAPAQGCSMCRETAAFQKDRAVGALKRGIVMLAVPPAAIAGGFVWLTWKRSGRFAVD